ncbi:MAG: hypothetical protein ACOX6Q_01570 [Candidatus Dojkabacteria bacterium]|jgi:hypothetical protein
MNIVEKISEGSSLVIEGKSYKILGKVFYATQNKPELIYVKILLEEDYVLVLVPSDKIAYFGRNEGRIPEFDGFKKTVLFRDKKFKQINHDYQVVLRVDLGSLLDVEGEVEFWDYEVDDLIVSIAIVSRNKERADVIAKYLSFSEIEIR